MGYYWAGFDVVGVDINPQPRYPFQFIQGDALTVDLSGFDAIHASPPCQSYSDLAKRNGNADAWPRLVNDVRERLLEANVPYVIENVVGCTDLQNPFMLCGTMFYGLRVLRHRLFEVNFPMPMTLNHGRHPLVYTMDKRKPHYGKLDPNNSFVQVTGGGNCPVACARDAMGIQWMTKKELNEAIPPMYTQWIGNRLRRHIERKSEAR